MRNFYILGSVGKKSVQAQEEHQGWGQRLGAYVLTDHCGPASSGALVFSSCLHFILLGLHVCIPGGPRQRQAVDEVVHGQGWQVHAHAGGVVLTPVTSNPPLLPAGYVKSGMFWKPPGKWPLLWNLGVKDGAL